jgi:hypothetical protein
VSDGGLGAGRHKRRAIPARPGSDPRDGIGREQPDQWMGQAPRPISESRRWSFPARWRSPSAISPSRAAKTDAPIAPVTMFRDRLCVSPASAKAMRSPIPTMPAAAVATSIAFACILSPSLSRAKGSARGQPGSATFGTIGFRSARQVR